MREPVDDLAATPLRRLGRQLLPEEFHDLAIEIAVKRRPVEARRIDAPG